MAIIFQITFSNAFFFNENCCILIQISLKYLRYWKSSELHFFFKKVQKKPLLEYLLNYLILSFFHI